MTTPTWTANTMTTFERGLFYETPTSNPYPAIVLREYPKPTSAAIGYPIEVIVFTNGAIMFENATRQTSTPTINASFIAIP